MKHNLYKTTTQRVGRYDISYRPGPENNYTPWCVHTLDGTLVSKWETRGKARAAVKGYILTAEKKEFKASRLTPRMRENLARGEPEPIDQHALNKQRSHDAGFTDDFYARYPFVRPRDDKS